MFYSPTFLNFKITDPQNHINIISYAGHNLYQTISIIDFWVCKIPFPQKIQK